MAEKVGTKLREVLNGELQFVGIIESFLHPKYMIVKPECPDVNGVVVTHSLEVGRDHIFELFNPLPGTERGNFLKMISMFNGANNYLRKVHAWCQNQVQTRDSQHVLSGINFCAHMYYMAWCLDRYI